MSEIAVVNWIDTDIAALPKLEADGVHIWLVMLDAGEEKRERFADLLDEREKTRAASFHFECDRDRFIAGRAQQRRLLAAYRGVEPADVAYATGEAGKLTLHIAGEQSPLAFNFSRSGAYGLVAVGPVSAIGVDIEEVADRTGQEEVIAEHFTAGERAQLEALDPNTRLDGFFCGWTRKEAVVKAKGGGLNLPLQHFEVSLDPATPPALLSMDGSADADKAWTLLGFRPMAGHWAALAVPKPGVSARYFRPAES